MYSYSLNSLIVFYEVVQLKSFSKAAEVLCLTQPGVSNHISQLEVQTGRHLLKREKGTIELTPEGKIIFKYAERIVRIAEELEKRIKNMHEEVKPHLNIGTTPTYSRTIMPELLGSFQKAFPQVMIKLDTGSSEEMENTLLSGHNDIVIVANPILSKKLYSIPFLKEELVLITPKDHVLSKKESISLREIRNYPLILREEGSATRKVVLSALKSMRITTSVLIEVKSTEFIKEWVSKGKGISVLIKGSILEDEKRNLKIIPLVPPLLLEISILFLKSMKYNIWIQKFIDHMRNPACNPFLQR
ncbi:MAG: LysR family transcriptional regulator [Thermodesulfobacteriota bacterium]|jgi:DNA-binding transcriptional LysR family regulator